MSILLKPTPAPIPKTKDVKIIATFYALLLAVLAITQLISFESFLSLMASFNYSFGNLFAYFVGAFIVAVVLFALPFLLRLPLSPAFRWFSLVCGWLAALSWLKVSLWLVLTDSSAQNVGFLGAEVQLVPGWWAIFIGLAFVILAAWASWGMWPGRRSSKRKK